MRLISFCFLRKFIIYFTFFLASSFQLKSNSSEEDSLKYMIWKDKYVVSLNTGYNTAPFALIDKKGEKRAFNYRANMNLVMGLGFAYKWFSFGLNFRLPGYVKNLNENARTQYFDLGMKFSVKKFYFETDLHYYSGFSQLNAYEINSDLTPDGVKNLVRNDITTTAISLSSWYFENTDFSIKAANGVVGKYQQKVYSPFIKGSFNLFGIQADSTVLPFHFLDTSRAVLSMLTMSALELECVPGLAYINNVRGWQFGGWLGLGLAAQVKYLETKLDNKGSLGLRPRIDVNLLGGYNIDDWFFIVNFKLSNKSIRFDSLMYRQQYYSLFFTFGHRFGK